MNTLYNIDVAAPYKEALFELGYSLEGDYKLWPDPRPEALSPAPVGTQTWLKRRGTLPWAMEAWGGSLPASSIQWRP